VRLRGGHCASLPRPGHRGGLLRAADALAWAYLLVGQHLPVVRAAELLGAVLGAPCSSGWMATLPAEAAGELGRFAEQARRVLATSEVVHVDETGARVAGHLAWV